MRIVIPVIIAFLAGCGPATQTSDNNTNDTAMNTGSDTSSSANLTEQQRSEGWQMLFDGQSKKGWHTYLNKGTGNAWKVENGELFLDVTEEHTNDGGDIITDQEYENFHLKYDWKISKNGNSGVMFSVKESPEYEFDYYTGPEMQVLDNDGHPDGKINKHRAGDLYDLISASPETVKPVGEWNTAEIIRNGDSLELRLNGPTVVKTTMFDDNWKKMVAGSKFKQWPAFGTFRSGRIALQDHGDKVWYRNIMIKTL
jgi:Domain of Unknown Function (DUF1080)